MKERERDKTLKLKAKTNKQTSKHTTIFFWTHTINRKYPIYIIGIADCEFPWNNITVNYCFHG